MVRMGVTGIIAFVIVCMLSALWAVCCCTPRLCTRKSSGRWRFCCRENCIVASADAVTTVISVSGTIALVALDSSCLQQRYMTYAAAALCAIFVKVQVGYYRDYYREALRDEANLQDIYLQRSEEIIDGWFSLLSLPSSKTPMIGGKVTYTLAPTSWRLSLILAKYVVQSTCWSFGIDPAIRHEVERGPGQIQTAKLPHDARFLLGGRAGRAVNARVAGYLDCPSHPEIVIAVTVGHLPPECDDGSLGGREVKRLAAINPTAETAAAIAFEILIVTPPGHGRKRGPAAVDVGAYAMHREVDDVLHPLPCSETPAERDLVASEGAGAAAAASLPTVDSTSAMMLSFFDGPVWYRAGVRDAVANCLVKRGGPQDVLNVMYVAEFADGTPNNALRLGDSGTPFFGPDGHLHSFLSAMWLAEGRPPRALLVPAKAALAQLRMLPALQGFDIRGFRSFDTVNDRCAAMRAPATGPRAPEAQNGFMRVLINKVYQYWLSQPRNGGGTGSDAAERLLLRDDDKKLR